MQPTWETSDGSVKLYLGDCLDVLPTLEAGGVDAIVTDPPYSLDIARGNKGCFAKSYQKITSAPLRALADSFDMERSIDAWWRLGAKTAILAAVFLLLNK